MVGILGSVVLAVASVLLIIWNIGVASPPTYIQLQQSGVVLQLGAAMAAYKHPLSVGDCGSKLDIVRKRTRCQWNSLSDSNHLHTVALMNGYFVRRLLMLTKPSVSQSTLSVHSAKWVSQGRVWGGVGANVAAMILQCSGRRPEGH